MRRNVTPKKLAKVFIKTDIELQRKIYYGKWKNDA